MMAKNASRQKVVHDGLKALAAEHDEIAFAINRVGIPKTRHSAPGFPTLLATIIGQQLSVKAASAIRGRVWALMDGSPCCSSFLSLDWNDLRSAGLSARKIEYAMDLAQAVHTGALPLMELKTLDDETATEMLTKIRGFGPWSAKIYLMFSEGRQDIYPPGDLALEKGLQILLSLPEKPTVKQGIELTKKYTPHRSAVCLILWALYGSATLN